MSAPREGTSPFNAEGHQYAWDSTSLGWLKSCSRLYYYHMVLGYTGTGSKPDLVFGIAYHSALEQYDRARAEGATHHEGLRAAALRALTDTWIDGAPWASDHTYKNRPNLLRSVVWYLDHFEADNAHTVILANGKPAVELSFRFEAGDDLILCGHLDRVVEFGGANYVMDRKTTATTPGSYYFDKFNPDNQMSLYTLAARVVYSTPVQGVIIDAAQIAVGFTRFERGITTRTQRQLTDWLDDTRFWTAQVPALEAAKWPMNDKFCGMYGGCQFRDVCSKSPEVRQHFLDTQFIVDPWNPLRER